VSYSSQTALKSDFLESVSEKVTSLAVYLYNTEITISNRFFEMVKLHNCRISSHSSFTRVQILTLSRCLSIRGIKPFKDIPYLELKQLPEVKDFSSLGSQRYLKIDDCPGLSNEAMRGFGNVFQLCISCCHNLTEVRSLNGNNRILTLDLCGGL
jgi:hypothetical protein